MANKRRLAELGMNTELAKEVAKQIDASGTDAIKTKPAVQALTAASTAADIVAALKA